VRGLLGALLFVTVVFTSAHSCIVSLTSNNVVVLLLVQPEGDSALHKKRERIVTAKDMSSKRLKQADILMYKS